MSLLESGLKVLLGPGLVAGFAGLGVLAEFERRAIPVAEVVGVNSGAFAAALWAVEADLKLAGRVAAHLPWDDFIVGRDLGLSDPLYGAVRVLTRGFAFEDCRRRASIFAVDLATGEPVELRKGCLALAVRHSMAIPGIFEPLEREGRALGDGGVAGAGIRRTLVQGGRAVAFWPKVEPRYGEQLTLHDRTAAYAASAWGWGPSGEGRVVHVAGPAGRLLDFGRIPEWVAAGRRAAAAWLGSGNEPPAEGGLR